MGLCWCITPWIDLCLSRFFQCVISWPVSVSAYCFYTDRTSTLTLISFFCIIVERRRANNSVTVQCLWAANTVCKSACWDLILVWAPLQWISLFIFVKGATSSCGNAFQGAGYWLMVRSSVDEMLWNLRYESWRIDSAACITKKSNPENTHEPWEEGWCKFDSSIH